MDVLSFSVVSVEQGDSQTERSVNKMTSDVDTVVRLTRGKSGKFNFRLKPIRRLSETPICSRNNFNFVRKFNVFCVRESFSDS